MKLEELENLLQAKVVVDSDNLEFNIDSACSADMMSSVLYYHTPNSLLITSLTQPHVVRTAEIAGIKIIVFVLNKQPDQVTIDLAKEKNIPILVTPYCMYTASGKLFEAGLPGCLNK
jgi:predicted transcriptional regulator